MRKLVAVLFLLCIPFQYAFSQTPPCIDNTCNDILANWGFGDATQTVFCEGIPVELVNQTTSLDIETFIWDWGDGHIDTLYTYDDPPPHTYNFPVSEDCPNFSSQVMNVTLTIFSTCADGQSCHYQASGISVKYKPRAEFAVATTVCEGDVVNFSDMSCFGEEWLWDFGDGVGTSTDQSPSYTYNTTGNFTVTQTVSNTCGDDDFSMTIQVIDYPDAEAEFTLSPLSGLGPNSACSPATINLNNISVPGDTYNWQISGTGLDSTTNALTPLEYNFSPGTYTITLTASNACGEDEWEETIEVLPSSNVTLDPIDPQCETFTFNAAAYTNYTGQIDDISWNFPNGTPATSTDQYPIVDYSSPGTYNISVSINGCGSSTITRTITLQIDGLTTLDLTPVPDICFSADTVLLMADPTGGIWSGPGVVGDTAFYPANASIGANTLTYSYGSGACSNSENMTINVIDITPVTVDNPSQTVCEDEGIVTLTANPTGGTWIGNGVSSNGDFDPSIVGAGNIATLEYEFTNSSGCTSSGIAEVIIEGLPTALLTQDTISFCESPGDINLTVELGITLDFGYSDEWLGNCVTPSGIFTPDCAGEGATTLQYVVFTPNSCSDTTDITVIITPFVPAVAMDDFSECVTAGDQVTLTATPAGGTWTGTNVTPEGIITLDATMDGDFTYTYTVFPNSNCEDADDVTITFINLNGVSAPSLSYCETEGIVTLPEGNPTGGTWYYNGTDLNGELDIQTFIAGDYTLQYEVESASSSDVCQAIVDVPLFIDALPIPDVIVPNEFCINDPDTIINNTSETYTSWTWDFGNGNTSNNLAPIVTYANTGDYIITLIVEDTICSDTFTWDVHVSSPPPPLSFDLTLSATDSCEILTAFFVNTSIVDPNIPDVVYLWNYGNGQMDTTYTLSEIPMDMDYDAFDDDTIYYVTLTALSSCGEAEQIGFDSIYVKPKPVSGFGAQYETYCSGSNVRFVNSSVGNPDNTIIDLGDGSPLIFDYPNDTLFHQYWAGDEPDTFYITFISSNECGIDTIIDTLTILPVEAVAGFTTADNGVYCVGLPVCVQNVATPGAEVWYEMGDGTTLFAADTCHTYASIGTYIITQYATDICGGLDTMQTPIEIILAPDISFTAEANVCQEEEIQFTATIANDVVNVSWDFGDGNTSTELSPIHMYAADGDYTVTLTGEIVEGCATEIMQQVTILPLPVPTFNFSDSLCLGEAVILNNTTSGITTSCLWQMDDGASLSTCDTSYIFATSGIHTITLTTTNENGCLSSFDTVVYVRPTPVADFTFNITEFCHPGTVEFTNTSTDANTASWDFGDSSPISNLDQVTHTFDNPGIYTVNLIVSYDGVCFDSIEQQVEIYETPVAIINIANPAGCEPFTPNVQNQSTGNNLTSEWQTTGGITFYSDDFQYEYLADNPQTIHDIRLIVEDSITGCRDTTYANVTVFDSLETSLQILQEIECNGDEIGSITAQILGGSPSYQYEWSNSGITDTLIGLPAGIYTVTVTDANNCMSIDTISLLEPAALALNPIVQDVNCIGDSNGSITLSPTGGTLPYSYIWSQGGTGSSINNLSTGDYSITLTDANGCSLEETFTIGTANILPLANITLSTNSGCEPLIVTITSNTQGSDLIYDWDAGNGDFNNESSFSTTYYADNPQSNYTISLFVQDTLTGCTSTASVEIIVFDSLSITTQIEDVSCNGYDDGVITATVEGGTLPYDYDWSLPISNDNILTAIAGNYTLTVTDLNGCTITTDVEIEEPDALALNPIVQDVNCIGDSNGSITLSPTGGTLPYSYIWSQGGTGSFINNLSTGDYSITLTDANGCSLEETFTIGTANILPLADITLSTNSGCEPLIVTITSNTQGSDLIYNWDAGNGDFNNESSFSSTYYTDNPQSNYTISLFVQDTLTGCTSTASVEITVFDSLSITTQIEDVSCYGYDDGVITATTEGGTLPYDYDWSLPISNDNILTTIAGNYTLTVTDLNGCTITTDVEIEEPDSLNIILEELKNATCAGIGDGSIDVMAEGGTTNTGNEFTYDWNINNTNIETDILSNLDGGFYTVTITDENACTLSASYEIIAGYELELMTVLEGITCEGDIDGSITIEGIENGIPGFNATLSGMADDTLVSALPYMEFNGLLPGEYFLTVIDSNACEVTESYTIFDWQDPYVEIIAHDSIFRCQELDLVALGTASGNPDQITYAWFPDVAISCLDCDTVTVSPELDITYEVTITDAHGCTATNEKEILVNEDRTFYIPNTFTPNGDGENDIFRIRAGEHQQYILVEVSHFTVLDRWGNVLYNAPVHHPFFEPNVGWKGFIDGVEVPSGMYTYWVEYTYCDGKKELQKGLVQLVR